VESNRLLRFSSRETLSWVIPRVLARVISSAISWAARASTFRRCAGLSCLIMSSTLVGMIIPVPTPIWPAGKGDEGKSHSPLAAGRAEPQLLHIRVAGAVQRIDARPELL